MRKKKLILATAAFQELSAVISEKHREYQAYQGELKQAYEMISIENEENKLINDFAQWEETDSVSLEDLRSETHAYMRMRNMKYFLKNHIQLIDQFLDFLSRVQTCFQTCGAPADAVCFRKDLQKCKELLALLELPRPTLADPCVSDLSTYDWEMIGNALRKTTDAKLHLYMPAVYELTELMEKHYQDVPEAMELLKKKPN